MNDKPKSVLDVIAWCENLEKRVHKIETEGLVVLESGEFSRVFDTDMKNGSGERSSVETISFNQNLKHIPTVLTSISGLNTDSDFNSRIEAKAENITTTGFDLVMRTWRHSKVLFIKVNWIALSKP